MSMGKFCKTVVTLSETSSITEAAKLMADKNVGCLVIVNEESNSKKPIGILTDRDIVIKGLTKSQDIEACAVKDIMNQDILLIKKEEKTQRALDAMCEKGVRRAPIIDAEGNVCGLVSVDDIIVRLITKLKGAADLIECQVNTGQAS
jgi:CBS domain-containing protein